MRKSECNCSGCQSRRAAYIKWLDKPRNRERKREINNRSQRSRRAEQKRIDGNISDEELDRRAILLDKNSGKHQSFEYDNTI
jgi:hypothetical protein